MLNLNSKTLNVIIITKDTKFYNEDGKFVIELKKK